MKKTNVFNLANQLTISRMILAFVFMAFLFAHGFTAKVMALCVFILASFTDAVDGFIAKKAGMVTDFGKLIDPIADKVLVLAAFISFVEMGIVPAWMVVIIIFREVAVTGLRVLALAKNKVIAADGGGKHKMITQVVTIVAILIFIIFREGGRTVFAFWDERHVGIFQDAIFALMALTTVLTLVSGVNYLVKNKEVYFNAKTG
ncbi:MAG: CDP-diacylglycerol--glycerol-3-phosphate 3-phosphatidyltransferase [Candidatus Omnitrophica bacterium]|nr:CDP-diacylglycerol--glycerol-3-phosphate 3-phosphatidyltransferase [Candidatus Omnitrophota bacterium]